MPGGLEEFRGRCANSEQPAQKMSKALRLVLVPVLTEALAPLSHCVDYLVLR
jgi:hypothetical protein